MTVTTRVVAIGQLSIPRDWELRSEATLLTPSRPRHEMPTVKAPQPAPRSNLVISRRAEARALGMLVAERRKELVKLWPNGRISAVEKHFFDDGAEGLGFEAHFSTQEFGPVIQVHRLRLDGGVATHVVATVSAVEHAELDSLLQVARSYRPPGEEPLTSIP